VTILAALLNHRNFATTIGKPRAGSAMPAMRKTRVWAWRRWSGHACRGRPSSGNARCAGSEPQPSPNGSRVCRRGRHRGGKGHAERTHEPVGTAPQPAVRQHSRARTVASGPARRPRPRSHEDVPRREQHAPARRVDASAVPHRGQQVAPPHGGSCHDPPGAARRV
jgi:hypothetical protein